ncbi:MAG: glutamate racemase [Treponema sp.]|nr:glutamate racemase [Treponema sp.]
MDKRPVLYMDSGIGGIPYCQYFVKRNPDETVHYLADRESFPYGPRERGEVAAILTALMEKIVKAFNPKMIVIACNTATISAIEELRRRFTGLFFVGTVPAVLPAARASKSGKVGVIATARTIADPCIRQLAGNACEISGIAAPDMVEFVDRRFAASSEDEKRDIVRKYTSLFREAGVDSVVLGCTHFLFLKKEFEQEAAPDIAIFDSVDGVTRRAESLLDSNALRANGAPRGESKFLLTGPQAADLSWQSWAGYLGFRLTLLDDACR